MPYESFFDLEDHLIQLFQNKNFEEALNLRAYLLPQATRLTVARSGGAELRENILQDRKSVV